MLYNIFIDYFQPLVFEIRHKDRTGRRESMAVSHNWNLLDVFV